jgi:hypothetical protein
MDDDALLEGFAQPFVRALLFFSAIWVGCMVPAIAVIGGSFFESHSDGFEEMADLVVWAPLLLLTRFWWLNAAFDLALLVFFIRTDHELPRWWVGIAILHAIFGMLGRFLPFSGEVDLAEVIAWAFWVAGIGAIVSGTLFWDHWQRSRWAARALEAQIESERAKAIREKMAESTPAEDSELSNEE